MLDTHCKVRENSEDESVFSKLISNQSVGWLHFLWAYILVYGGEIAWGFAQTMSHFIETGNWNSITGFLAPVLCPALGRFEKLLKSMNSSVFLANTACIVKAKQNCRIDTGVKFEMCLNYYKMHPRSGAGKINHHSKASCNAKFLQRWGLTHRRGSVHDEKSFTEYLKTEKMQKTLCSMQSGCQKSAELPNGRWQRREKAGGWVSNSKIDGTGRPLAGDRWANASPRKMEREAQKYSQLRDEARLAERHKETESSWAVSSMAQGTERATLDSWMSSEAKGGLGKNTGCKPPARHGAPPWHRLSPLTLPQIYFLQVESNIILIL